MQSTSWETLGWKKHKLESRLHSENEDHGIWSHHFMGNRWGNSGNSDWLCFLGSKITADGDCSHEIKRHLLLGRKVMTNLDRILKSRDITFLTKVCIINAIVFSVVMYRCESWTIKKVECWRTDAFELWCWRRQGSRTGEPDRECCSPWVCKESDTTQPLKWTELKKQRHYFADKSPSSQSYSFSSSHVQMWQLDLWCI